MLRLNQLISPRFSSIRSIATKLPPSLRKESLTKESITAATREERRKIVEPDVPNSIVHLLKPKTFRLAMGDGATDEYAYKQRRGALERIYDDPDNLAKANFILSYAGKSTMAPWSTKEAFEFLVGTSNCMHTHQAAETRDNSKMLLSMYMFSSDLFSERLSSDLVPILSNFKNVNLAKHEQYLRLIDPRCPLYFLTKSNYTTYHSIKQHIVPHWQNPSGNTSIMACSLSALNIQGSTQEIALSYIIADVNKGVYDHGVRGHIQLNDIPIIVDELFKKIPKDTNYVHPIIHNGLHAATNAYLAFRIDVEDQDGLAEDVLACGNETLCAVYFDVNKSSRKQIAARQEIYVDRFHKNEGLLKCLFNCLSQKYSEFIHLREYPEKRVCEPRIMGRYNDNQLKRIYFPKLTSDYLKRGNVGKWNKTELYPTLLGLVKSPENNLILANDQVCRNLVRHDQSFIDRQNMKLDPEWWGDVLNDPKIIYDSNLMCELSIFTEYFRYNVDIMYSAPLLDIPYEQHKYLGNREYEKNVIWGDIRDWELDFMEKNQGVQESEYYSADGSWSYLAEYESESKTQTKAVQTNIWE